MFEHVHGELNGIVSETADAGQAAPLPANPRVQFLLTHGAAMDRWKMVPFYLGLATAPLWDHRSLWQQVALLMAFMFGSGVWMYLVQPWVDRRVGVFEPRTTCGKPTKESWRSQLLWRGMYTAVLMGIALAIVLLTHGPRRDFEPRGWMEKLIAVWICMLLFDCVDRARDRTNLQARRLWNVAAAGALLCSIWFLGATANSYAVLLVLLGVVNIALALLDLGLLLHFAATPLAVETEETVHG